MALKTACKTAARSLLTLVSLAEAEVDVDPDAVLDEELLVELDPIPVVELFVVLKEAELLPEFPSNALIMACSICCRRSDVDEPPLDDEPLAAAPVPPSQPPICCAADAAGAADVCEALLLWDCCRKIINASLELLEPLMADMGDLCYFPDSTIAKQRCDKSKFLAIGHSSAAAGVARFDRTGKC